VRQSAVDARLCGAGCACSGGNGENEVDAYLLAESLVMGVRAYDVPWSCSSTKATG